MDDLIVPGLHIVSLLSFTFAHFLSTEPRYTEAIELLRKVAFMPVSGSRFVEFSDLLFDIPDTSKLRARLMNNEIADGHPGVICLDPELVLALNGNTVELLITSDLDQPEEVLPKCIIRPADIQAGDWILVEGAPAV